MAASTHICLRAYLVRGDGRRDHREVDDIRVQVERALGEGVRQARVVLQLLDEGLDVVLAVLECERQVVWGVQAE